MLSRQSPPSPLQINLPAARRQYMSAISPSLTPITASSTYSPVRCDDTLTPFDSRNSFELELKFTEDKGEYIFTVDSPYGASRATSASEGSWAEECYFMETPNHSPSQGALETNGSVSSYESDGPLTIPDTPDRHPLPMVCDSPTIPGADFAFSVVNKDDLQEEPGDPRVPLRNHQDAPPVVPLKLHRLHSDRISLLSPITIVLDTIQEHSIADATEDAYPTPKKPLRMKSLPKIGPLPAINLFEKVFDGSSRSSAPALGAPRSPLSLRGPPPPPPSTPTPTSKVLVSYHSPIKSRAPPPRPFRGNSEEKLDKLLGRAPKSVEARLSSFNTMPFQYEIKAKGKSTPRLYDMI